MAMCKVDRTPRFLKRVCAASDRETCRRRRCRRLLCTGASPWPVLDRVLQAVDGRLPPSSSRSSSQRSGLSGAGSAHPATRYATNRSVYISSSAPARGVAMTTSAAAAEAAAEVRVMLWFGLH